MDKVIFIGRSAPTNSFNESTYINASRYVCICVRTYYTFIWFMKLIGGHIIVMYAAFTLYALHGLNNHIETLQSSFFLHNWWWVVGKGGGRKGKWKGEERGGKGERELFLSCEKLVECGRRRYPNLLKHDWELVMYVIH